MEGCGWPISKVLSLNNYLTTASYSPSNDEQVRNWKEIIVVYTIAF
jgi:hypothetical protein